MSKYLLFSVIFTILGAITLFGNLFWSMYSNNGIYFLYGYPISAIFLIVAYVLSKKIK